MGRLHQGTVASFQANEFLSDQIEIHNGIRQDCPLAPMLFVLALDLLFRRVEQDPACPGISIKHEYVQLSVPMAGYADDTVLFLRGPQDEAAFVVILTEFEASSRLTLNRESAWQCASTRMDRRNATTTWCSN